MVPSLVSCHNLVQVVCLKEHGDIHVFAIIEVNSDLNKKKGPR